MPVKGKASDIKTHVADAFDEVGNVTKAERCLCSKLEDMMNRAPSFTRYLETEVGFCDVSS